MVKPTSVDDGRDITQMLLSNRTVVLNLEGLDMDLAQRLRIGDNAEPLILTFQALQLLS